MAGPSHSRGRIAPLTRWLLEYQRNWLRCDAIAGVTLAAYAVPVSLAYAGLAGLPPQTGLYCYLVAGLGYAIFGSSRHLAIGPTSAISLAGVALAGVLLMGILDGVIIAVLASVLMLLWRVANSHVAFLGRIPGTDRFSDVSRHPENEPTPGVVAFRVEASLVYFNVDHVLKTVLQRLENESAVRRVVYDLSNTPYVDVAGARMLRRLYDELASKGIAFRVVGAHAEIRDRLRYEQLQEWVGPINRHLSLAEVVMDSTSLAQEESAAPPAATATTNLLSRALAESRSTRR